jgi:hypothetical protein
MTNTTEMGKRRAGHGMKRNDHYSDRAIRRIFGFTPREMLEAKAGRLNDRLEDMRFCPDCETFFCAEFFISEIKHGDRVEFVCARCADRFERLSDADKVWMLDRIDIHDKFWESELKMAHGDHEVGERPMQCTPCFAALAFRRY